MGRRKGSENKVISGPKMPLGPWADLGPCDYYVGPDLDRTCKGKTTHVVFVNRPEDIPYCKATCRWHAMADRNEGWTVITLGKFWKTVRMFQSLLDKSDEDLPTAMAMYFEDHVYGPIEEETEEEAPQPAR